jgi:hypothetical protein
MELSTNLFVAGIASYATVSESNHSAFDVIFQYCASRKVFSGQFTTTGTYLIPERELALTVTKKEGCAGLQFGFVV